LPEFDDGGGFDVGSYFTGADQAAAQTPFTPSEQAPSGTSFEVPSSGQYTAATPSVTPEQATANTQAYGFGTPAADTTNYGGGYGISAAPKGYNISTGAPLTSPLGENAQVASPLAVTQGSALTPEQQAAYSAAGATPPTKDFTTQLKEALTPANLARLGLTAGLGAFGASQARKAGTQNQAAVQQQQNIAQPYQTQGQQLIAQAQAGQLSPESQAAFQAAKAQLNQNIANRGGVGVQQAANQEAQIYQTLLNNQYTYGLQVAQIGDNIALGAIRTGLQLDQTLNQATTNFYTQLASLAAGGGTGGQTITIR